VNQEVLRDTISEARRNGCTVVFSTHNMDQAEQLCDFVCIIARGRKVLDGALGDIRRGHAGHRYRVVFESVTPGVLALMEGPGAGGGTRVGEGWELELPSREAVGRALMALASADVPLARFERVRPSLHQIFVEQVGQIEGTTGQQVAARA
jgi:ABC-2 type transport system ATP-binding protein